MIKDFHDQILLIACPRKGKIVKSLDDELTRAMNGGGEDSQEATKRNQGFVISLVSIQRSGEGRRACT